MSRSSPPTIPDGGINSAISPASIFADWYFLDSRFDPRLKQPVPIHLDDIHASAGPVMIARKKERPAPAVISQFARSIRQVGIVNLKANLFVVFTPREQSYAVIDGEFGKTNDVKNRLGPLWRSQGEAQRGLLLMRSRNGKDHSPMTPQRIRLPRAAAIIFQQLLAGHAERTQGGEAGEHNFFRLGSGMARTAGDDAADEGPVFFETGRRQLGRKARMIKKLPGRPNHHKTAMRIPGRWVCAKGGHSAGGRIHPILPDQFVRERKRVPLEREAAGRLVGGRVHVWREI